MIRIALIDDHGMVVEGLEAVLARFPDLELVARGGSVDDARDLLVREDVDVVLLDVRLEDGNGLQVLAERPPRARPRVLVISSFNVTQYAAAAVKFGAAGFLLKVVPVQALVRAIRVIDSGGVVFGAEHLDSRFVALTPRERSILQLAMEGQSNKEIGSRLGLHRKTVEAHLSGIFEKYEIHGGRIELSIHAAEEGWLQIQPPTDVVGERVRRPHLTPAPTAQVDRSPMHERSSNGSLDRERGAGRPAAGATRQAEHGIDGPKDPAAVDLGRRGGLKGGPARALRLGQAQRSEIARRAAKARWGRP